MKINRRKFVLTTAGAAASAGSGFAFTGCGTQKNEVANSPFKAHREELAKLLYEEYLPFWDHGGYDKEYGGFICNLNNDGIPVDDEKFIWYQGRAVWVYSYLYNNFGGDDRHLKIARNTRDFMVNNMYLGNGKWAELVHRDGNLVKGAEEDSDVYGWLFAANGLAEFYKISGDEEDIGLCKESIRAAVRAYDSPSYLLGTDDEGKRFQGHSMVFIRLLTQLLSSHRDDDLPELLDFHLDRIMNGFFNPEYGIFNEKLQHDYSRIEGREDFTFLGHSLETQWMVMDLALRRNDDALFQTAKSNFRRYIEMGWDHIYDGWGSEDFYVFGDQSHAPGAVYSTKTMWAHTEILIGCMMIFEKTGEYWAEEWYWRTWEYLKDKFCRGVGAWEQAVDRQGEPKVRTNENIHPMRRGNYHQPRFLMLNILSIDRMIKQQS